ncbi:MAG: hypothetical protein M1835_004574 [Candelina submexicana]|nr:MAG: hypothetical protein M1835_004574 [Candelina submexicana]
MAGRRLLDAAAIFNASRSIASKHITLDSHQVEAYKKTSSLAKSVKSQNDRVTLTIKAASALARRFNGSSSYSDQAQQGSAIPSNESTSGARAGLGAKEGLEHDHFYERSQSNSAVQPMPDGDLGVKQVNPKGHQLPDETIPPVGSTVDVSRRDKDVYSERPKNQHAKEPLVSENDNSELGVKQEKAQTNPLPDGSIPPARFEFGLSSRDEDCSSERYNAEPIKEAVVDGERKKTKELEPSTSDDPIIPERAWHASAPPPEEARRLQREAETQIPSQVAEQSSGSSSNPNVTKLEKGHDEDVFYSRPSRSSPTLSSLPRTKLPRQAVDSQNGDDHVTDGKINLDVFGSSPQGRQQQQEVPRIEALPEQYQVQENVNTDVFHSPRVAKLLAGKNEGGSKGFEMKGARRTPFEKTQLAQGKDQDTFNVRSTEQQASEIPAQAPAYDHQQSRSKGESSDPDVQSLAADIARDEDGATSSQTESAATLASNAAKKQYQMRESRVPSSRFGRLWQYGGLATGMAIGAVSESISRVTRGSDGLNGSLILSAGNMERLVAKLSKMRGAALKLGQMMSFQDSKLLPAPIQQVLQRVQDNADYMPTSQRNRVLAADLGSHWRDLFSAFDEMPMAAASIGQVHGAVLKSTGQRVAVKVQYPGVASSIDSDLNNLSILLTASRLLPKGLYLEKTIANARTELAWECDYIREAECGKKFGELLQDEQDVFVVPSIIDEASGKQVLTMERMEGIGVTKVRNITQEQKDWIGTQILRLCLREITEFSFMQTDPNWTNFLYNDKTRKLELLDFGASRSYPSKFIDPYIRLLLAASRNDRDTCRALSIQLGYLTGHESSTMLNAHITSILTLAEPFRDSSPEVYDFRDQSITERVKKLIPVMVRERLAPPPEETYSLHRKLSGAFLLCARLGSRIRCREMFANAMSKAGVEG